MKFIRYLILNQPSVIKLKIYLYKIFLSKLKKRQRQRQKQDMCIVFQIHQWRDYQNWYD